MPLKAIINGEEVISSFYPDEEWIKLKELIKVKKIKPKMPCCGGFCFARTSFRGLKHFYHKPNSDCVSKGESYEHLYLKSIIFKLCIKYGAHSVTVEKNSDDWISDVYCEINNRKIVFEIQLSKQSLDETIRRTKKYKEKGIECYWLFQYIPKGYDKYIKIIKNRIKIITIDKIILFKDMNIFIKTEFIPEPGIELYFPLYKIFDVGKSDLVQIENNNKITLDKYIKNILLIYSINENLTNINYSALYNNIIINKIIDNKDVFFKYHNNCKNEEEKIKMTKHKIQREMRKIFEIYFILKIKVINKNRYENYYLKIALLKRTNDALIQIIKDDNNIIDKKEYFVSEIIDNLHIDKDNSHIDFIVSEFIKILPQVQISDIVEIHYFAKYLEENKEYIKPIPVDKLNDLLDFIKYNLYLL